MPTPFWLQNPNVLFNSQQIWPVHGMTFEEKLNAITRLILGLTVLGYFATRTIKIPLTGLATLGAIVLLYFAHQRQTATTAVEGFTDTDLYKMLRPNYTEPSVTNPVMNVLLPEISDNPLRKPAAPAYLPVIESTINEQTKLMVAQNFNDPNIDERLFKDLGDNFNFDQSMRAWHPMPSTTVPNDQQSFADYCYGDMISCRDTNNNEVACTRSMPPRWTNY